VVPFSGLGLEFRILNFGFTIGFAIMPHKGGTGDFATRHAFEWSSARAAGRAVAWNCRGQFGHARGL